MRGADRAEVRVTQNLVRALLPEEHEYARYLAEVEARKRRAADLRAEVETLTLTLGRFEAEYQARVGVLFVELDRLRLAAAEYERRIALLTAEANADLQRVEQDVEREFATRREEVRAEGEDTRRYEQAYRREQERPRLDADAARELKRLYRELAKRYHPDLARTDEESRQREATMRRVNAAFRDGDLTALETLYREAEVVDPTFEARSTGEKLVWAIREVVRLDGVIAEVEAELAAMRASETHELWRREEAGEAVLATLVAELTAEVAVEWELLDALIVTYRRELDRRTA